jgi:cytochrome c oxidase subunit II
MKYVLYLVVLLVLASCGVASSVAPPTATPTTLAVAQQGEALFLNKGCVTCHRHDGLQRPFTSFEQGPELTSYSATPDFLRQWLADPATVRPNTEMPNLKLSASEIEALIAFLNR